MRRVWSRVRRKYYGALALLAGLVLVAGCGSGTPAGDGSPSASTLGSATPRTTGQPTAVTSTPGPTTPAARPTTTVAGTTVAGPLGGRARFEVFQLRGSGHLVVLDFGVRGLDNGPFAAPYSLSRHHKSADVSGVYLYDRTHRRKYWPVTADGACVCSTGIGPIHGTKLLPLSATYAAPPRSVHRVEVHFATLATVHRVPIHR